MPFTKGGPKPPGSGRKAGTPDKHTVDVRDMCREWLEQPAVVKRYRQQLVDGTLSPPIETLIWHYAHGKPKETVVHEGSKDNPLEVILSWQPLPHHDPPASA